MKEFTQGIEPLETALEGANGKLAAVASDLMGKSGREMLEALVAGNRDAAAMAELAKGKLREKLPQLQRALTGRFGLHHPFLVAQPVAHIDFLEESIAQVSQEIAEQVGPFEAAVARLDTIPGVGRATAAVLVAETGTGMSRFPTATHLASWTGMCPDHNESAGKRNSGKTRKGTVWLRAALIEAVHAAGRTKDTYRSAQYHRLLPRRGKKQAAVAVGHSILVIAFSVLQRESTYQELGYGYCDQRDREATQRRLTQRLEHLGYKVTLEAAVA